MRSALLAQIVLIEYLRRSPGGRTVREILSHLQVHSDWGREQLAKASADGGLRVLQGWLLGIRDSADLQGIVDSEPDPEDRRRLRYRISQGATASMSLPIEEAAVLVLAELHLSKVLPSAFRSAVLDDVFHRAQLTIERHEASMDPGRLAVRRYVDSIVAISRGLALVDCEIRSERIDVVLTALLERRCLVGRYRSRERRLHACGLVMRDPKVYLVAAEADPATGLVSTMPKVYSLDRFESLALSTWRSEPPEVDLDAFVAAGSLEAPARGRTVAGHPERIDLAIRIHDADASGTSVLLNDLREYPLSPDQRIDSTTVQPFATLTCPDLPATEALICWILGRADRIEVVEPNWLRREVGRRVNAVQLRYAA